VIDFFDLVFEINKVDKKRFKMFWRIFILYHSKKESEIIQCFKHFKIEHSYAKLWLYIIGSIGAEHLTLEDFELIGLD
jgi:hypothetical protein